MNTMTSDEATLLSQLESFLQQQIELSKTEQLLEFCQHQNLMFSRLKGQLLQKAKQFFAAISSSQPKNDANVTFAELPTERSCSSTGQSKLSIEFGVSPANNSSEHHQSGSNLTLSTHSRKDNNVDALSNCDDIQLNASKSESTIHNEEQLELQKECKQPFKRAPNCLKRQNVNSLSVVILDTDSNQANGQLNEKEILQAQQPEQAGADQRPMNISFHEDITEASQQNGQIKKTSVSTTITHSNNSCENDIDMSSTQQLSNSSASFELLTVIKQERANEINTIENDIRISESTDLRTSDKSFIECSGIFSQLSSQVLDNACSSPRHSSQTYLAPIFTTEAALHFRQTGSSFATESDVLKFFSNSLKSLQDTPQCVSLSTEHNQETMAPLADDLNPAQSDTTINGESRQINEKHFANSNEQNNNGDKCIDDSSISSDGHVSIASKLQNLFNSKLFQNSSPPMVSQPSTIPISGSEESPLGIPKDNDPSRLHQLSNAKFDEHSMFSKKQSCKHVSYENDCRRSEPSTSNDNFKSTFETVPKPSKPKREPIKAPSPDRSFNKYRNNQNASLFSRPPLVFNRNDIGSSSPFSSFNRPSKILNKTFLTDVVDARDNLKKYRLPKKECLKRKQTNDACLSSNSSSENDHVDDGALMVQLGLTRTVSRCETYSNPKKKCISADQRRGSAHSNNSDFTPYVTNKRTDHFEWVCPDCKLIFQTKNEYNQHARVTRHGPSHWPEKDLRGHIQQKRLNDVSNDLRSRLQKHTKHESLDQIHGNARHSSMDIEMISPLECSNSPFQAIKQHTASHYEHVDAARQRVTSNLALPRITVHAQPMGKPTKYPCSFGSCTFCTLDPHEFTQHELICSHKVQAFHSY